MPCQEKRKGCDGKSGRVKVMSQTPFVKLLYGSSRYKPSITLGVDSGSKVIGVAAIGNGKTFYASEVKTGADINVDLKPIPKLKVIKRISARKSCLISPVHISKY